MGYINYIMNITYRIGEDLNEYKFWTVMNTQRRALYSQKSVDFPSEPIKHLGSHRVTKTTPKQEVHLETLVNCSKFKFSGSALFMFSLFSLFYFYCYRVRVEGVFGIEVISEL